MMPVWSTALPDWEERIMRGESLIPFPVLFPASAQEARAIFSELRIVDALGSPKMRDIGRPWIFQICDALFGSYDGETGRQCVREFMILIPKKNGKSSLAACFMLTALLLNARRSAEYCILAPTLEVASNAFGPARDAVASDPHLNALCHVAPHLRTITHRETGAVLKVIAADSETVSGKKATGILIEELHLWGKRPNGEAVLKEATGALAARPEGFCIFISTQSDQEPRGVFKKTLSYARNVRDGVVRDAAFCPILYEFPKAIIDAGQHLDPRHFGVVNPNINLSVSGQFLQRELAKSREGGAESLALFASKHLDIEIGLALRSDRWTGADHWAACGDRTLTLDKLIERSEVVVIGIDGGGLDDLLGLAVLGRDAETRDWLLWSHAWCFVGVLERRKSEASRLRDFERDGDLTIIDKLGDDVTQLCDIIERVAAVGLLPAKAGVGADPYGISAVADELVARKLDEGGERIAGVAQGWKLGGAIKGFERKLAEGTLRHSGSGLMAWCVGNAKVEPRANSILITKQASGVGKIDVLMAALDAATVMALNPQGQRSVFDTMSEETFQALLAPGSGGDDDDDAQPWRSYRSIG